MSSTPWDSLLEVCVGAHDVVLAAPYVKAGALGKLLSEINGRVQIVTRWTPLDIASGVSDIACRPIAMAHGGEFYLHPSLHAKYYRFDEVVLVGSANLTATALGYSDSSNLEILCLPGSDFDAPAFEYQLFQESHEVTDQEFSHWLTLDTAELPPFSQRESLPDVHLGNWRPSTRDPNHLWQVYSKRPEEIASPDERRMAEQDLAALSIPPGLSYAQFHTWIVSCVLASPFVDSVFRLPDEQDQAAWYRLAQAWGIPPQTAARDRETAQIWRTHFLT